MPVGLSCFGVTLAASSSSVIKHGYASPLIIKSFTSHSKALRGGMPSGHSAASFAGLVMIGMLVGGKIKWLTWTLAVVIGLSRIMIGAHWPSDVLLGAFIGMVSADFVLAYFRKK